MKNLAFVKYLLSKFVNNRGIAIYADRANDGIFYARAENIITNVSTPFVRLGSRAALESFIDEFRDRESKNGTVIAFESFLTKVSLESFTKG